MTRTGVEEDPSGPDRIVGAVYDLMKVIHAKGYHNVLLEDDRCDLYREVRFNGMPGNYSIILRTSVPAMVNQISKQARNDLSLLALEHRHGVILRFTPFGEIRITTICRCSCDHQGEIKQW